MNNFWVGLKNKKGLFLAILALFTVTTVVLGDNTHQAYAKGERYEYNTEECKKGGFEYKSQSMLDWGGHGCVITGVEIIDGKPQRIKDDPIGSPEDMARTKPKYLLKEGGECFKGYAKKTYGNTDVCELKKGADKAKDTGLPPGSSLKNKLTAEDCEKYGGHMSTSWGAVSRCMLPNLKGGEDPYNNLASFPSKYLTTSECAPGYIKDPKEKTKKFTGMVNKGAHAEAEYVKEKDTIVYVCAKKGTKAGDKIQKCIEDKSNDKECTDYDSSDEDTDDSKDKNSCAIEWIGWIMCPVIRASNGMVVSIYSLMQQHFLNIKADEIFQQDKPAFKTWSGFRDMANVFFVIVLAIIIFSQVSGVGISNYGIKKMLPKIIVFAILVNISWYISVLMIDISNIVGHSLFEWLAGDGSWQYSSDSQQDDSPVEQILSGGSDAAAIGVGTAAAITGALAAGSSILLFLFSAALALIMMVFILLVRQAAVIVLVVISPVAFVAGILPNTEGFFRKWAKFLKNMLMIYPICSLIVGGAIFVSNLLYSNETSPLLKAAYGLLPILSLFTIVAIIKSILSIIDGLTGGNLRGTLDRMSGRLANAAENGRPMRRFKEWEGSRKFGGLAIGKDAREEKYQQGKATRRHARNKRELNRLLSKDNLTEAEHARVAVLGGEIAAHEKKQVEGMSHVMRNGIAGDVGNVDNYLQKISNVSDPAQKGMMQGALTQAVANSNLSAADKTAATAKIIDDALESKDEAQIQAAMAQINSNMSSDMKNANPAMAKALAQNPSGQNLQKVSDFQQQASTYSGANAQKMAGWSEMSKPNPADNQAINAMKSAFSSGDQNQIAHAQNMGKVADQALKAHNDGKMFLTPNQERNFKEMSNLAKANAPAAAAPANPTPAPAPASSQNMKVGVSYNVNNNNSQIPQYGAPAPSVDQYKSNRKFGPQHSK